MQRLKYFSGIKPTVEDLEFDQEGKVQAVTDRQKEMFTDGVVEGLLFKEITPGEYIIEPGLAYVNGERIVVTENQVVAITPTQEDKFIFLKFQTELDHPVQHFVTGETFNIYQVDSFSAQIREGEAPEANEIPIARVSLSGVTDLRQFTRVAADDRIHTQNTDIGTSALDFRVGLGAPEHPEGMSVVTQSPAPPPPLFPRIKAILPVAPRERMLPSNPQLSRVLGRQTSYAQVIFTWNFLGITGVVLDTNEFRMDDAEGYAFEVDELENYHIRFHSGQDFRILHNTATDSEGRTTIEVEGDLTGVSTVDHPAQIHPDVTEYRWSIVPIEVEPETPIITDPELPPPALTVVPSNLPETVQGSSTRQTSPVMPYCTARLPVGRYFMFMAQSVRYRSVSDSTVMRAGSYDWQGMSGAYTCPFLVEFPAVGSANLTLTALPNGRGFTAEIEGWEEAEFIEYGWRRLGEGGELDFSNPANHVSITHQRAITVLILEDLLEILQNPDYTHRLSRLGVGRQVTALINPAPIVRAYLFAARPLMGRQVAGATISGTAQLTLDPNSGQTPIMGILQSLASYCDILNMHFRNLLAERAAMLDRVEDQLTGILNTLITDEELQYTRFAVDQIILPYANLPNLPEVAGTGEWAQGANQILFDLAPEDYEEQVFVHNIGHLNYMVMVRDADGVQVAADIDLDANQVTVRLTEQMAGTVLILY